MYAGYYASPETWTRWSSSSGSARSATPGEDAVRRSEAPARPRDRIIGDPDLVFLDEPTTGFDPAARRAAWEMIRSLRSLGKTILLTTHYLDEAQQLADRVAVLREGVSSAWEPRPSSSATRERPRSVTGGTASWSSSRRSEPTRALHELTADALAAGRELEQLEVRRPTLEDVYLELVGDDVGGREHDDAAPSAHVRAAHVLAKPRGGSVRLHLPAPPVRASRVRVRGRDRRCSRRRRPSRRAVRVRRRDDHLRRRRDHTSSVAGRPACSSGCARPRCHRLRTSRLSCSPRSWSSRCSPPPSSRSEGSRSARACPRTGSGSRVPSSSASHASRRSESAPPHSSGRPRESRRSSTSIVLPMAFLSGSFGPTNEYPAVLQAIADVLPLTYFLDIVYGVYLDGESLFADPTALGVMVAWASQACSSPYAGSAGCRARRGSRASGC